MRGESQPKRLGKEGGAGRSGKKKNAPAGERGGLRVKKKKAC